jgi:hypothetical protein
MGILSGRGGQEIIRGAEMIMQVRASVDGLQADFDSQLVPIQQEMAKRGERIGDTLGQAITSGLSEATGAMNAPRGITGRGVGGVTGSSPAQRALSRRGIAGGSALGYTAANLARSAVLKVGGRTAQGYFDTFGTAAALGIGARTLGVVGAGAGLAELTGYGPSKVPSLFRAYGMRHEFNDLATFSGRYGGLSVTQQAALQGVRNQLNAARANIGHSGADAQIKALLTQARTIVGRTAANPLIGARAQTGDLLAQIRGTQVSHTGLLADLGDLDPRTRQASISKADQLVADRRLKLTRATQALQVAEERLSESRRRKSTGAALAVEAAEIAVQRAREGLSTAKTPQARVDAQARLGLAQDRLSAARERDTSVSGLGVVRARDRVAAAQRGVRTATAAASKARNPTSLSIGEVLRRAQIRSTADVTTARGLAALARRGLGAGAIAQLQAAEAANPGTIAAFLKASPEQLTRLAGFESRDTSANKFLSDPIKLVGYAQASARAGRLAALLPRLGRYEYTPTQQYKPLPKIPHYQDGGYGPNGEQRFITNQPGTVIELTVNIDGKKVSGPDSGVKPTVRTKSTAGTQRAR